MHLTQDDVTTEISGLEAIPGNLTVIGSDAAGQILESGFMEARTAFYLTVRMRRMGWHPQGVESDGCRFAIVFAKRCIGRTCQRCAGTGFIPYYGHIDKGRCFSCQGTGRPQETLRAPWLPARKGQR